MTLEEAIEIAQDIINELTEDLNNDEYRSERNVETLKALQLIGAATVVLATDEENARPAPLDIPF